METWVRDARSRQGLEPYQSDPVYRSGAQAGAEALARGEEEKEVVRAVESAVAREVNRLRTSRPSSCITHFELLELAQLGTIPALLSPDLRQFGLGTRLHEDKKGKRLSTVIMLDGPACQVANQRR